MKKLGFTLLVALTWISAVPAAFAHHYYAHYGYSYGYGYGYNHGYHSGAGAGFLGGLLASTAAVFTSHVSVHHKELAYVGAADEAAAFLQNGGEPSALLREALETERDVLVQAGMKDAESFSDEILAELVLGRIDALKR